MFIDRIIEQSGRSTNIQKELTPHLQESVVFDIANVAQYLFVGSDQEYWDAHDFPNVAPLFETMFFEFPMPAYTRSTEYGLKKTPDSNFISRIGFLVHAEDIEGVISKAKADGIEEILRQRIDMAMLKVPTVDERLRLRRELDNRGGVQGVTETLSQTDRDQLFRSQEKIVIELSGMVDRGTKWCCEAYSYSELDRAHESRIAIPRWRYQWSVHNDGTFEVGEWAFGNGAPDSYVQVGVFDKDLSLECERNPDVKSAVAYTGCLYPVFLALCFAHCGNVSYEDHNYSEAEQRARLRRGKPPLLSYKTLLIDPMRRVLERDGGMSKGTGLKHALHICRGHFKDYSKGGGLFGRNKGLYWWDAHVRGSSEHGIALKDYEVHAK